MTDISEQVLLAYHELRLQAAGRVCSFQNTITPGMSYADQARQPVVRMERLSPEQMPPAQGGSSCSAEAYSRPIHTNESDSVGALVLGRGCGRAQLK